MKKTVVLDHIYDQAITIDNLNATWNIVRRTCKNKKAVYQFLLNANTNISNIYWSLKNKNYQPSKFHLFLIFEPKPRLVMSQTIADKIINHFVTNYYLIPYLGNKLTDCNVATRKEKGSKYALELLEKYLNILRMKNKDKDIFCLKIDISKYFYTIDHGILLEKLKKYIIDQDVLLLINKIISETNKPYINDLVSKFNSQFKTEIPFYRYGTGLSIGAMSSQFLAIYFLNDLDHYIKEKLKCKYYIRYMDDFIILDNDLGRLKEIWKDIEKELYKLNLVPNPKSNIFRMRNGFTFLGYRYRIVKGKLKINYCKQTYKRINKKLSYFSKTDLIKYYRSYSSYYGYLKKIKPIERRFKMKTREKYDYYKVKYPKSIVIIKEGSFYKTYENDAIILWHIFGYKWNNNAISFGSTPYMRVLDKLMHLGLGYVIIKEEELFVDSNDEVYDSYLKLALFSYSKYQKRQELINMIDNLLEKNPNSYDKIKVNLQVLGDEGTS